MTLYIRITYRSVTTLFSVVDILTIDALHRPASVVLNTNYTVRETSETLYEIRKDSKKDCEQCNIVRVRKKLVLEHLSLTPVIVTTKVHGLVQFDAEYGLATHECLPAKIIIRELPCASFMYLSLTY